MMGATHAPLGGLTAILVLETTAGPAPATLAGLGLLLTAAGFGAFYGMLPDIDHPHSLISNFGNLLKKFSSGLLRRGIRRSPNLLFTILLLLLNGLTIVGFSLLNGLFQALAWITSTVFGHRGATHSFLAAGIASLPFAAIASTLEAAKLNATWWWVAWAASLVGYVSHLLSDGFTHTGQPLFWPLPAIHRQQTVVVERNGHKVARTKQIEVLPAKVNLLPKMLRVSANGLCNMVLGLVAWPVLLGLLALPYMSGQVIRMVTTLLGGE